MVVNPFADLIKKGIENCYLEWGSLIEQYTQRAIAESSSTRDNDLHLLYMLDCIGSQFIEHGRKDEIIEPYVTERVKIADEVLTKAWSYDPHNRSYVS